MTQKKKQIAVIGGGPAGMMAAIRARQNGAVVTIYERNDRLGKKILATGNGKCNFTNDELSASNYAGSMLDKFDTIYESFDRDDLKAFFLKNGMLYKSKKGYYYPNTEQAATVLDLLVGLIRNLGISVQTECLIQPGDLEKTKEGFFIHTKSGGKKRYDAVILTCGGVASPKTGSDGTGYDIAKGFGHRLVPVIPSLVQLYTTDENAKAMAGVRTDAHIALYEDGKLLREEAGELQLTDYGVSGIPVFQLSRFAGYSLREKHKVTMKIDFLREYEEATLVELFEQKWDGIQQYHALKSTTKEEFFHGFIQKKVTMVLLKRCGMKPTDSIEQLQPRDILHFVRLAKGYEVEIKKPNTFEHAQVSAGGISSKEVNADLSSKLISGLYFAGEMLDLDGMCGGYNLQWAFSSGYCAGDHASSILE